MGELLPSEPEGQGHAAECGCGVYTSRTFARAVRYGISHCFPGAAEAPLLHGWLCKMMLLTAVPGEAEEESCRL